MLHFIFFFQVERVLDSRNKQGKRQFLIKWKGYNRNAATWEPEENLNCSEAIEQFEAQREKV